VNSGHRISEAEAWRILRDVASGLAYLHNHKPPIVHQDIKPGNILIGTNGSEECYMITDFGISAKMRNTIGADRKSFSSGTIAYMGPERFGDDAASVKASDIWSLGATLCELMTGDVPFGENGGQAQKGGVTLMDIPVTYSSQLTQVIKKCLDLEPWKRPDAQNIAEIADYHVTGKKKFKKLYKILIAVLAICGLAIGSMLYYNSFKAKRLAEMEQLEIQRNDSLSNVRIDKAFDLMFSGDTLLTNSIDNRFEDAYISARNEIISIDIDFGDKVHSGIKERAAKVDSTSLMKIMEARDTLQRKSDEVRAMGIDAFEEFIAGLNKRISDIDTYLNNN